MKKYIDLFSRIFVGGLFIFSGLIKLNDPIGTQIKMEEYFEVFAQDIGSFFHAFVPLAMPIGFFLIVLEVVLGIAILIHYKMNLTTWILLGLMLFFTGLTFYSAYFNKVTDCGCFGDAIKLTPWESFTKDIILMVFVLHLFWYRKTYQPMLTAKMGHGVMAITAAVCIFLGIWAIEHLPFIDFRAYKVGAHIPTNMIAAEQPIIEYLFEKDGQEVASEKFLPADQGYKYKSSRVLNEDKIKPKITDYAVYDVDGNDITAGTFEGPILFFVMYDIAKTATGNQEKINALATALDGKVRMLIITSSSTELVDAYRHKHQLAVPFAFVDATVLKTIIRSNPGIALWNNGTVLGNWHNNDTPSAATIEALLP
jgi:uncharacterized membrane protein YphA (DoxX/SURF4 family)